MAAIPVFIDKRSDFPPSEHLALLGRFIDHQGTFVVDLGIKSYIPVTIGEVMASDAERYLRSDSDVKPRDFMPLVREHCKEGDRYIIFAHNDGAAYDKRDKLLLENLAKDYGFSCADVVIFVCEDNQVTSESLYTLHFSE